MDRDLVESLLRLRFYFSKGAILLTRIVLINYSSLSKVLMARVDVDDASQTSYFFDKCRSTETTSLIGGTNFFWRTK